MQIALFLPKLLPALFFKKPGLQIEGVLAYFTHLKCQKCIGDDVGDFKYVFTKKNKKLGENDSPIRFIHLVMQE
jgi:hypothetical protein